MVSMVNTPYRVLSGMRRREDIRVCCEAPMQFAINAVKGREMLLLSDATRLPKVLQLPVCLSCSSVQRAAMSECIIQ